MRPRRGAAARFWTCARRGLLIAGPLGALLASSAGCAGSGGDERTGALESAASTALSLDTSVRYQRITGFGASSAWIGGSLSEAQADTFFSAEKGIGLSLLRVHITPEGTTVEIPTAQRAAARGASVWAAPWSPPGEWKTSGTATNGGSLLPEFYADWAQRLVGFAASMKEAGVPLLALSAQNEPNWTAEWETCTYTPEQLVEFVGQHLAPALERRSPETKLIAPETIDWSTLQQFADPLLADSAARDALDVIAVHDYGGVPFAYAAPAEADKELWETEVSYDGLSSVQGALETARRVHRHLTVAGVNAFHYWWLVSETSGGLMQGGELLPQAYGLGHYSKFVRPGYVRVGVPATPRSGVSASAYFDPESHRTVLVLVNENSADLSLSFRVEGATPLQVRPWVTTADESLKARPAFAFDNPLTYVFPSESVTTLVLSETAEPTEPETGGEGGASSQPDPVEEPSGEGGAREPSEGGEPAAGGASSGPGAASAGASSSGVTETPPPTTQRGAYAACSVSVPARESRLGAPLAALLVLACRRRRREPGC